MTTRITLALALVFAALATVPASAQPRGHYSTDNERTCGYQTFQYDSSGATTGPYCD
jgi:hypothetical protein